MAALAASGEAGAQLPHKFSTQERPLFADQLQMLQPQEEFSSGEMNSSASRGGPGCGAGGGGDSSGSWRGGGRAWGDDCTSGLGLALLGHFALLPFLARRLSLLAGLGLCSNYTFLWRLASSAQPYSLFGLLLGCVL